MMALEKESIKDTMLKLKKKEQSWTSGITKEISCLPPSC